LGILAAVEEDNGEYRLKDNWERSINQDGNIDLIVFKAKRGTGTTGRVTLKLNRSSMTVACREDKNNAVTSIRRKKSSYE
jgi:hypothetical protein